MRESFKLLPCLVLPLVALTVTAQAEDLLSLSLDELLQVNIASRTEEREVDAPSVVSVITAAVIQRFGARNLRDVLDRVVNTQIIGSNLYPHNRVSMRGVTQTHTDNKVLLLLNGRVLRDGNQGGINSDIYNLFPLPMIRKIEIIRGPGSVIYGTNAFSGAINIITYNGHKDNNLLEINAGSFDSYGSTLMLSSAKEDKGISIALNYQDIGGDSFDNIKGEFGTSGTYPMNKNMVQIVSAGHYRDIDFNFLAADSDQGNVKSLFQFPASSLGITRTHTAIGYKPTLSNMWSLDMHIIHNYQDVDFDISNTRATRTDSQDTLTEVIGLGKLSPNLDMLVGANFEYISGTLGNNSINPTPFNFSSSGGFAQATWIFDRQNRFTFGLQRNYPQDKSANTSPRIAYIHKFDDEWTLKSLYGEAYRSPFATDLFLNSATLQGNPDLMPERIKTFDIQLIRQTTRSHTSFAAYSSKHIDLHNRETVNGVPTFVNSGRMRYQGVELESQASLSKAIEMTGNASYQHSKDEEGTGIVTYNPEIMIKLGISYKSAQGISYGLYENYFSDPVLPEDINSSAVIMNPASDSYHLVTFNMIVDLNHYFNDGFGGNTTLALYIDNLLDEQIYFPSINRTDVNSLPHHAGRGFYLTLRKHF